MLSACFGVTPNSCSLDLKIKQFWHWTKGVQCFSSLRIVLMARRAFPQGILVWAQTVSILLIIEQQQKVRSVFYTFLIRVDYRLSQGMVKQMNVSLAAWNKSLKKIFVPYHVFVFLLSCWKINSWGEKVLHLKEKIIFLSLVYITERVTKIN